MLRESPAGVVQSLLQTWDREIATPVHRIYISSFSASGDDLSHWRAYGQIAIGIEPQNLERHGAFFTRLQPVEYNREKQKKLADVFLSHSTQAYEADLSAGLLERIPHAYHRVHRLMELAAFFKDLAFQGEREYRFAYIEDPDLLHSLRQTTPPTQFRVSKSKLFPFIISRELMKGSPHTSPLEIHEVVLGPATDELLERGVREFLDRNEMRHVKLKRSTVPYRT
jgi:hypothetical protein